MKYPAMPEANQFTKHTRMVKRFNKSWVFGAFVLNYVSVVCNFFSVLDSFKWIIIINYYGEVIFPTKVVSIAIPPKIRREDKDYKS